MNVVTPFHSDLVALLKEGQVVLLDEVREMLSRINEMSDEIGSLIISAQWSDKQGGLAADTNGRHPYYDRPPEIVLEFASPENGSFIGIDEPDVWNIAKMSRTKFGGSRGHSAEKRACR